MNNHEEKFRYELELFRIDVESGIQFFYSYLAMKEVLAQSSIALDAVNKTPLFWKTHLAAIQQSSFIVLGRIFDKSSKHSIFSLIDLAEENTHIFSKSSLAMRKRKASPSADSWLPEYLSRAHEPTIQDFKRLRLLIERYDQIYYTNYRKIRNKVFAHKVLSDRKDIKKLFEKTNIRELERLFVFLNKLYWSLWELLENGMKPILRPMSYSTKSILNKEGHSRNTQERIVSQTKEVFNQL